MILPFFYTCAKLLHNLFYLLESFKDLLWKDFGVNLRSLDVGMAKHFADYFDRDTRAKSYCCGEGMTAHMGSDMLPDFGFFFNKGELSGISGQVERRKAVVVSFQYGNNWRKKHEIELSSRLDACSAWEE